MEEEVNLQPLGGYGIHNLQKGDNLLLARKRCSWDFMEQKNKMDIKLCKHLVSYGLGLVISQDFFVIENTNSCAS
jgi:hypothetical protein